jgi:hypothetical protein
MPVLIITDGQETLLVDEKESADLELKLNVTSKGRPWSTLSAELFAFGTYKPEAKSRLVITSEQLTFLKVLQKRQGWVNCKDL